MKTKSTLLLIVCLFAVSNIFAQTQNFNNISVSGRTQTDNIHLSGGKLDYILGDNITYKGHSIGQYSLNWIHAGIDYGPELWQSAHYGFKFFTTGGPRMCIDAFGNVGIGYTNPGAKLDVNGTIRAHEIKVCLNQGCDYVFAEDYNLMTLNDLNSFIKANKHLPEVAPAAEMEADGINVSEMNALLLKKVEELTLYVIELKNEIDQLKK